MILEVSVTLHFTVGKLSNKESLNYKLMPHLTMRCMHMFKEVLKTLK